MNPKINTSPMDERNFSKEIHQIMEREMGEMGEYFIRKQCHELAILPEYITANDIPRLSRALSAAMEDFGKDKSSRIIRDMKRLMKLEEAMQTGNNNRF